MYPEVMSEDMTLAHAIRGRSIARFGDGEMRLMTGESIPYNKFDKKLQRELSIVAASNHALPCIPNIFRSHRKAWLDYEKYGFLFPLSIYGSQFINRPDSAPWTDTDEFRSQVRDLWEYQHATLVYSPQSGNKASLTPSMMKCASLRTVECKPKNAYDDIDEIEERIGTPTGPVVMCLGPTATVLAHRLARKGVWALDMGMIGIFINRNASSPPLPR